MLMIIRLLKADGPNKGAVPALRGYLSLSSAEAAERCGETQSSSLGAEDSGRLELACLVGLR